MNLHLNNRVAAVAASSGGLGFGSAMTLAQEGCRIAMCARRPEKLEAAAQTIRDETGVDVLPIVVDMSDPSAPGNFVNQAAEHFGQLDIVVANAGGPPSGPFESMTDEQWEMALQLNTMSTARIFRAALPHVKQSDQARLIAITSITAKQPLPNMVLSNSARAAVHGLVKTLSAELASTGVTVNNVCPGIIRTDRITELSQQAADRDDVTLEEAFGRFESNIPMQRLGTPMEFGAAVTFLCSKQASFITGSSLLVDGGMFLGL